jgi:hypothetical protein
MSQTVSCQPLTAKVWVQSEPSLCEICGAQSGTGTDFSASTSAFPCQYLSTNAPYSSSSACCSYEDRWAKSVNVPKTNALSEIGEHWVEKDFQFFFCLMPR